MRILLLGSNGQVGTRLASALSKVFCNPEHEVFALQRNDLDLIELSTIKHTLDKFSPDFIVNASAYTAVDEAESQATHAFTINSLAVKEVAEYCDASECSLIHISTDYVFDGYSGNPYTELDCVSPASIYGRSKLAGEEGIREALAQHIILRTSWVFGATGGNFVTTMLRLAKTREEINVVADQVGSPTSAVAIADTIVNIISEMSGATRTDERWGTYHFCGAPYVSWAGFAETIFELATSKGLISSAPVVKPINSEAYPTAAERPANSRLDGSKLTLTFGIEPDDWKSSLGSLLDELKEGVYD